MKSLTQLWNMVADELGHLCGTSTEQDRKTVLRRVEHEGVSFLTISLPKFGKDFQKSLDQSFVDHNLFQGFAFRGGLPLFLGGFLDLVFDRGTGKLIDSPNIDAIFAIRQLTLLYGKIAIKCTPARERKAIEGYINCEYTLKERTSEWTQTDYLEFSRMSRLLGGDVFRNVDVRIGKGDIVPKHGPGATADKLKGNRKFVQSLWPSRLEESAFPASRFLISNDRFWRDLERVEYVEPGDEIPVRVITVPKTLDKPRIIAIEPTAMQYAQQAIYRCFVDELSKSDILRHFIKIDDQTLNQRLALKGSVDGSLATLDLSEASDRVSNQLVRAMLSGFPHFAGAVDASRSRKADVPGHGVIRLAKFASMGSALCFPMEALVFLTLIFQGIQDELNFPLNHKSIKRFYGRVCVFGDDLIVPKEFVPAVVRRLEAFGFRVNSDKSFWTGKFRESCGKDYYDGHDITVARCRDLIPTRQEHVGEIVSLVSLRNQLYELGLWKTCQWLDGRIVTLLRYFPTVHPTSPVLGRHSKLDYQVDKMSETLHSPLVKGYVVKARNPISKLDNGSALLKWFLLKGIEPLDKDHLERAGRPDAVSLKLRWTSPY